MSASPSVERAKSYLDVQITRSGPSPAGIHPHMHEPFITVSRECGTRGTAFAHMLADRLNMQREPGEQAWQCYDEQLVEEVLREEHLSPRLARFLPEDRVPEITGSVGEIVGLHPNLWTLVQKTNTLIRTIAQRGHAIFVGRGANLATANIPGGLHLRLVGREAERIERIANMEGISTQDARNRVRRIDAARAHYVASAFDRDVADCSAYDLVFNVTRFALGLCIEMVVLAVTQHRAAIAK